MSKRETELKAQLSHLTRSKEVLETHIKNDDFQHLITGYGTTRPATRAHAYLAMIKAQISDVKNYLNP